MTTCMVDAKYVVGQDVKVVFEEDEDSVPFSFPATGEDSALYADLTMAKKFPANSTPYTDALTQLADYSDVTAYFVARDQDFGGVKQQEVNNIIQVNDESGVTSPASGIFFGTVAGKSRWKGDSHAYRDQYDPSEIPEWVELDLEDVEPALEDIVGETSRKLTDTGYENIAGQTVPTLEFEDVKIPNTANGQELRTRAIDSLHQALENGDYHGGPPPSYLLNQVAGEEDTVMDIPRILSVMMEDAGKTVVADMDESGPSFYLGDPGVEIPPHIALTYVVRNAEELEATEEFVEAHTSDLEPIDTELQPEEDPMVF